MQLCFLKSTVTANKVDDNEVLCKQACVQAERKMKSYSKPENIDFEKLIDPEKNVHIIEIDSERHMTPMKGLALLHWFVSNSFLICTEKWTTVFIKRGFWNLVLQDEEFYACVGIEIAMSITKRNYISDYWSFKTI